jgi:tetratricopeptide (TPR) repeat protein
MRNFSRERAPLGSSIVMLFLAALFLATAASGCAGEAAFHRGLMLSRSGDPEAAVRSFEAAIQADPTNVEYRVRLIQAREEAAYLQQRRGEECLERGDVDCAILSFQSALDLNPSYEMAERRLRDARKQRQLMEKRPAPEPTRPPDDSNSILGIPPDIQSGPL